MSFSQIYDRFETILERVSTEIHGKSDPIIGAYIVRKGIVRLGTVLRTINGTRIGEVRAMLVGTVGRDDPHRYVQACSVAVHASILIDSKLQNIDRFVVA